MKYYTQTILAGGSSYDDAVSFSLSGTVWTSGIIQNLDFNRRSNFESLLKEQGKVKETDLKLYIAGSHSLSGAAIKIGTGSPPTNEYRIIEEGVVQYPFMGDNIYNKVYIRRLTTGSLFGE